MKKHLLIAFVFTGCMCFASNLLSNDLVQEQKNIEKLIQEKKYDDACRETEYLLGHEYKESERKLVLDFAINKLKFFINIIVQDNYDASEDSGNFLDLKVEDLSRAIIGDLSEISFVGALDLANEILTKLSNKFPETTALIIEEVFYNDPNNSIDFPQRAIAKWLSINESFSAETNEEILYERYVTIHNILSCFCKAKNTALNVFKAKDPVFAERCLDWITSVKLPKEFCDKDTDSIFDLASAVNFGKKIVEDFFDKEKDLIEKLFNANYEQIRQKMREEMQKLEQLDDEIDQDDIKALEFCRKFLSSTKEENAKAVKDYIVGIIASVAISTSLVMTRPDGVAYIKEIYEKSIKLGYSKAAQGLKKYLENSPKTKEEDGDWEKEYGIINPAHILDEELLPIPEYLKIV